MKLRFFLYTILFCVFGLCHAQNKDWTKLAKEQENYRLTEPEKSIKIGEDIIAHCDIDSLKAKIYCRLGSSYLQTGDYKKSLEYHKIARYELAKHHIKTSYKVVNLSDLSSIYNKLELFDKSKLAIDDLFKIIKKEKTNDKLLLALAYNIKAEYFNTQKEYDLGINNSLEALKNIDAFVPTDDLTVLQKNQQTLNVLSKLCTEYNEKGDYIMAEKYALKALSYAKESKNIFTTVSVKNILADSYVNTNRPKEAITIIEEYKDNNNISLTSKFTLNNILSQAYSKLNDSKNSEYYRNKKDSILEIINKNKINASNDLIKLAEEEKKEEEQKVWQNKMIYSGIILLLVATIVALYFYYKNNRRKERAKFEAIIRKYNEKNTIEPDTIIEEIAIINTPTPTIELPKEDKEVLSPEMENYILEQLDKFEKTEKYLSKDLTLSKLASTLKVNTNYLSHVINAHKQKNFNSYINELRINHITQKIYENSEYTTYKISYLAELSGFTSHSAFATVFKNITGISPSSFIEMAQEKQNKTE